MRGRPCCTTSRASADALACNLRGDVPAKLGLTYEHLKAHNPKIVCAHLTAYGRDGPRADWPGFDYLMQAEAGYFCGDRRSRRAAGPLWSLGRRHDDGPCDGLCAAGGADGGARDRRGPRHRCEPLRLGAPQHQLSCNLVSERKRQPAATAPFRAPLTHPLSALYDSRRLDLPHVQQGKVLAGIVPSPGAR